MASNFNMTKGQPDWQSNIDNFMNEYYGNDSGAMTTGIVLLNGVTLYGNVDAMRYQTFSNASGLGFAIWGGLSVPVANIGSSSSETGNGQSIDLFKLPTNVVGTNTTNTSWLTSCSGGVARLNWDPSVSVIRIDSFPDSWTKPSSGSIWVDTTHAFMTHK